jgi:hypothetical protein
VQAELRVAGDSTNDCEHGCSCSNPNISGKVPSDPETGHNTATMVFRVEFGTLNDQTRPIFVRKVDAIEE